jgi:hypothetical protein
LHRTYISDVERGCRNLGFHSLMAIARGLGVTLSELTRDVGTDDGPLPLARSEPAARKPEDLHEPQPCIEITRGG